MGAWAKTSRITLAEMGATIMETTTPATSALEVNTVVLASGSFGLNPGTAKIGIQPK